MEIVTPTNQPLTLTFQPRELQTLAEITGRIGGSGPDRDFTNNLQDVLKGRGYTFTPDAGKKIDGSIYFE